MILYEPKENVQVVFTKNKDTEFNNAIRELGYAKKDGNPYKYVNIQKGSYLKLDGADDKIPAIKISAKGKKIFVVDDTIEFKTGIRGVNTFVNSVNAFGSNYELNIDGRPFKGKFKSLTDNSVKDSDGVLLSIGGGAKAANNPEVNTFIYKMRQDNGNLLAPIMRKYITALHFTGKNRKFITGYAHLPTYLQLIKSPFGDLSKSLRKNKHKSGMILGEGKNDFMAKVVVRGVKGRKVLLDLQTGVKLSSSTDTSKTPNPYVVFTTKPIKFNSEDIPQFAVNMGRQIIFVTIFMFYGEKYLGDVKGGMNLLKMW